MDLHPIDAAQVKSCEKAASYSVQQEAFDRADLRLAKQELQAAQDRIQALQQKNAESQQRLQDAQARPCVDRGSNDVRQGREDRYKAGQAEKATLNEKLAVR